MYIYAIMIMAGLYVTMYVMQTVKWVILHRPRGNVDHELFMCGLYTTIGTADFVQVTAA